MTTLAMRRQDAEVVPAVLSWSDQSDDKHVVSSWTDGQHFRETNHRLAGSSNPTVSISSRTVGVPFHRPTHGELTVADVSRCFADSAADATFDRLGAAAQTAAKMSILDTLGVALAASGMEPASRFALDLVEELGGRPESSVVGRSCRVPAVMAAFANGVLAHSLDFDDQTPWGQHSSSSVVPAALALAERRGGVSGRELITAVAVAQDLFARLRCHVEWRKDWNLSSVFGAFAAAVAGAKVLGHSGERIHHALGIASQQSCGVMEVVAGTGSDLRGSYAGFSAKGGVLAALLADRGLTGVSELFEGTYGIFNVYFAGEYDREAMIAGLGTDYLGASMSYKPWPVVGTAHSHVAATIRAVTDHELAPRQVAELRVRVGDYHRLMCTPLDARRRPATLVDARFSLPFLVAVAAVRRSIRLADFTDRGLGDPDVLAMAERVVPIDDPSLDWRLELPPGVVEVVTHDGRTIVQVGTDPPGSPRSPLSWDHLGEKFASCAAVARPPLSPERAAATVALVRDLESLPDATQVLAALT
jgi:2-methylcitrate dehydratase PrpD